MNTKSKDNKALPKLKKNFLPLVENCRQIDIEHHFFLAREDHSPESGSYAVNNDGELIHLIYTAKQNINWTLLALCKNLKKLALNNCELVIVPDELFKLFQEIVGEEENNKNLKECIFCYDNERMGNKYVKAPSIFSAINKLFYYINDYTFDNCSAK